MKNNTQKSWDVIHTESLTWARWMALYELIQMVAEKAEKKGIDFDKLDLKPLKILEYIDSTQDIYLRKILKNDYNIDICYSETNTECVNKID